MRNQFGLLNPNYKEDAPYRQDYFCKCGAKITYNSVAHGKGQCRPCGRKSSSLKLMGRIAPNKGIPNSTGKRKKETNEYSIVKHHKDCNKKNNNPSNFMYMGQAKHRSLHCRGYEYLVTLGLHLEYTKQFIIKYDVNILPGDGKILHHMDCDRKNNEKNNFIYLPTRALHNKLHQEAYLYLVKIGKIDEYIAWFESIGETKSHVKY